MSEGVARANRTPRTAAGRAEGGDTGSAMSARQSGAACRVEGRTQGMLRSGA